MNAVTFTIECDLDGDGTWETDLSPYANLGAGGLKISRGMAKSGEYVVSSIEVGLTNQDGRFSPEYSASPLYGLLEPHVPIRVTASHLGRTYTLWSGYVDTWRVSGRGLASVCSVTASDVGKYLVDSEAINLTVSTSRDTAGAIAAVFDQMGLEATDYWLDDGVQDLPYSFAIGQKAMTACMEFVRSEMGGHLFVLGDGRLRFQNRRRRLGVSRLAQEVLLLAPAGYWRFGELSGASTAADSSGNARNGTYGNDADPGAAGGATGDHDGAAAFDGNNDYVSVADAAVFDATDFSVFGLVKRGDGLMAGLVSKFAFGPNNGYNVWVEGTDSGVPGRLAFEIAVAGTTQQIYGADAGDDIPDDDAWHSFAITRSGGTLSIYADGALVRSSSGFVTGALSNSTALEFGRLYVGNYYPLNGWLDEFAFFSAALSAEEVTNLHLAAFGAWVWGDGTNVQPNRVDWEGDDLDLVTSVTTRGTRFLAGQDGAEVFRWAIGRDSVDNVALQVTANIPYKRTFKLNAPVLAIYSATAVTDFAANDNADGSGTDRTGSLTVTYTLNGSGEVEIAITSSATCYITHLRVRGQAVAFYADRPEFTVEKAVPNRKAGAGAQVDVPFAAPDSSILRDWAFALAFTYRQLQPRITTEWGWDHDDIATAMLWAELGTLVKLADCAPDGNPAWVSNADDWYYVEKIEHTLVPSRECRSRVTLVPAASYRDLDNIAYDRFDRGDSTGLGIATCGVTWSGASAFNVVSTKARPAATSASIARMDVGAADVALHVSFANLASDSDEVLGVVFRYQDASNYLRAVLSDATNELLLTKVVAGAATDIGTYAWTPTATAELWVQAQGNRIRVWLDRVLRIVTTDGSFNTETEHGIYGLNTTTGELYDWYCQGL